MYCISSTVSILCQLSHCTLQLVCSLCMSMVVIEHISIWERTICRIISLSSHTKSLIEPSYTVSHVCTFLQMHHRLYSTLLTSCLAKILKLTPAALHFSPPVVKFLLSTRWTRAVQKGAKLCQSHMTNLYELL